MVDVELLLSDNGGVRIYPTEWHNTIYFGYQKNANIYRLHIVRSKVWQNLTVRAFFHTADIPYVVSENSGVEDGTTPEPESPAWRHINTSA